MGMCTTYHIEDMPIEVMTGFGAGSPIILDVSNEMVMAAIRERDERLFDALEWAMSHYDDIYQADHAMHYTLTNENPFLLYEIQEMKECLQNPFLDAGVKEAMQLEIQQREEKAERVANCRSIPESLRKKVLNRDGQKCRYCGVDADCVDHVLPFSRGGRTAIDNLVSACQPCNSKKYNHTLEEIGMTLGEPLS